MRIHSVKIWPALLPLAALIAFVQLPATAADDPVVARVNGVEIKNSDLDFAASEVGPRISNYVPEDRRRVLLQYVIENELMAGAGQKDNLDKTENFAALAKEKSKDTNAEGGDLGFFSRGQMLKPFEDAAFSLDVGKISEPVQTQFGWHIIKVEEKRKRPLPSFDEVKEAIMGQLVQQKAQEVITGLRNEAEIEIVDPALKPPSEAAPQSAPLPPQ